jgi:4-amino-4-deoxy-L-arabinose transferase-like glycosyltransferase
MIKITKGIWPILPLLFFYILVTLILSTNHIQGDEGRYLDFAKNILNGHYADSNLKPGFLWNGPGYPLLLTPFIYLNLSLLFIKLVNAFLLFLGCVFVFKSMLFKMPKKPAIFFSYLAGVSHIYTLKAISLILTEALSFFLVALSMYLFLSFFKERNKKYLIYFSITAGVLLLTKVFFSYVFLSLIVISLVLYLIDRSKIYFLKFSAYPFIICLPYLIYTYSITDKFFYWSDAGGSSLYFMSTPYENEYGDWFPAEAASLGLSENSQTTTLKNNSLYENHNIFFKSLEGLNGIEKDEKLKQVAFNNIIENKLKFAKNIIYNIARMSFRFPFTNRDTNPLVLIFFIFHFSFFFFPFLFAMFKVLQNKNVIDISLLLFILITFFGMSVLSAVPRFTFPLVPVFFYILSTLIVKNKNDALNNSPSI